MADRQYAGRLQPHERKPRRLVADGTLPGTGRGRSLQVPAGALYDWRGKETPALPEWGLRFEVFPDEAAEQVQRLGAQRDSLHELLKEAPLPDPAGCHGRGPTLEGRCPRTGRGAAVAAEPTRAWSELLAIERIVKNTGLTMPPCGVPL